MIKVEAKHVFEDPDCYSMADFIRAKNGSWLKALATTVKSCETHVNQCQARNNVHCTKAQLGTYVRKMTWN